MDDNEEKRFDEKDERGLLDSQKEQIKSKVKEQTVDRIKDRIKEEAKKRIKDTVKNAAQKLKGVPGAENVASVGSTTSTTAAASGTTTTVAGTGAGTTVAASGTTATVAGAGTGTTVAASGTAATVAGAGTTATVAGAGAGTTVAASGITAVTAGGIGATISFLLVVVLVILILIAVIGMVAALMFLPSFTLSTVKEWVESALSITMQWIGGGDSAKFKQEEIAHVLDNATYIRRMGYNLYNEGYIYKKLNQMEEEAKAAKRKKEVDEETGLEKVKLGEITDSDVYVPEEGIYEDESGNVKALSYENSPLLMYTWIDGYTYFIDEMPGILFNLGKTIGKAGEVAGNFLKWIGEKTGLYTSTQDDKDSKSGATKFPGMLKITDERNIFEKFINRSPKVTVDLDTYTMRTEAKDFFGNNRSNINYTYDIQGWIGRYGLPLNLLITMHKATNAPDMLVELIRGTKYENEKYEKTKLNIELTEVEGTASIQISLPADVGYNGKLYYEGEKEAKEPIDKNKKIFFKTKAGKFYEVKDKDAAIDESGKARNIAGKEVAIDKDMVQRNGLFDLYDKGLNEKKVEELFETISKKFGTASKESKISKIIPILSHSENHWYRDIYFKQKKGDKYIDIDGDYLIKTGETWLKRDKEGNAKEEEQKEDWSAFDPVTEKEKAQLEEAKQEGTETVTPITANDVDDDKNSKELKEAISSLIELLGEDKIQLKEKYSSPDPKQYSDGRRGITNKRLLDLINNHVWYKYDGTEATANKINEDREKNKENLLQKLETNTNPLKKKITFSENILQAGAMLQQSDDLDSKYAYKDLKELLVDLKYYKRDDLRDPIRKILTWPLHKTGMGETWPAGEKNTDVNKYGVNILSEEAVKAEFGITESTHEKIELEKVQIKILEKEREIDRLKKSNEQGRDEKVKELEKELETLKSEYELTKLNLLEESTARIAASGSEEELAKTLQSLQGELSKETDEKKKNSLKKRIKIIEDEQKKKKAENVKNTKSNNSINSNNNQNTTNDSQKSRGFKDDPVYRKLKARYGQGYKEDEYVVSPVTGKLEKGKDGEIIIKALDEDDLPNVPEGYKRFYDSEYKGIIAGYKIKLEGVQEETTDKKGTYKQQISKNSISKIVDREEREKVEKVEKEKKDAPERYGEYVKEGTIIGKVKDAGQTGKITVTMYNNDESIVERPGDYFVRGKSGGFIIKIDENYDTRTSTYDGELPEEIFNELDPDDPESVEIFKKMFSGWVQGKETIMETDAEAFLKMQKEYGVNAIFAAAVTMVENTGGTNLQIGGNNYFSQKDESGGWRKFKDVQEALDAFGKNIARGRYYYRDEKYDVKTIGPVYCERKKGADKQWEDHVVDFMTKALKKAEEAGY